VSLHGLGLLTRQHVGLRCSDLQLRKGRYLLDQVRESVSDSMSELPLDACAVQLGELLVAELHELLKLQSTPCELPNALERLSGTFRSGWLLRWFCFYSLIGHAKNQR
jgi:hypothetical protein